MQDALYRLPREATTFWQNAPGFMCRETIHQRVLNLHRNDKGEIDLKHQSEFKSQEIVAWYTLGYFRRAPEALREFRRAFEIDGKPVEEEAEAKAALAKEMNSPDDHARLELVKQFEKQTLASSATDFGQLLLLFTRKNLDKYSFEQSAPSQVGADPAVVIAFKQVGGSQALRIVDGRTKVAQKLQGTILVRQGDYLPLRITLNSTRDIKHNQIRDEASVDYSVAQGALLPASLTYRRFVNKTLMVESTYRYSSCEAVTGK